ncbi:hypothetical protein ACERJO_20435 [Halalkalibacter sp. AB-rgal2]|uniref:hypothetical protein n=1 Tax=Halalkalibacter sp. AB-rgal2 TaxID=3242695 RepID=UPI00359D44DA
MSSFPFNTYSGLLTADHYKRMGNAIWLFLWCISSTTKEIERDGETWGIVLGNKPIKNGEIAVQFGVDTKTVQRWIDKLRDEDYLRTTRAPYGLIFTVKNSKKYRSDKKVCSENDKTKMSDQSDRNVGSEREQTKMSELDQTEMSDHTDKNVRSNKDTTEILQITTTNNNKDSSFKGESGGVSLPGPLRDDRQDVALDAEIPHTPSAEDEVDKLANRYIELRATGLHIKADDYQAIQRTLAEVPFTEAIKLLESCFLDYEKTKRPGQKINSFSYCEPYIIDRHHENVARLEARKNAQNSQKKTKSTARFNQHRKYKNTRRDTLPKWLIEEQETAQSSVNSEPSIEAVKPEKSFADLLEERKKRKEQGVMT